MLQDCFGDIEGQISARTDTRIFILLLREGPVPSVSLVKVLTVRHEHSRRIEHTLIPVAHGDNILTHTSRREIHHSAIHLSIKVLLQHMSSTCDRRVKAADLPY